MVITPVGFGYLIAAPPMIRNCSMIDAPSGTFGTGKSREALLATYRIAVDSNAMALTLIPGRKLSALDVSSAGNRTTVSDCELLTQTRFCASMATSKGDFRPATLTIWPV